MGRKFIFCEKRFGQKDVRWIKSGYYTEFKDVPEIFEFADVANSRLSDSIKKRLQSAKVGTVIKVNRLHRMGDFCIKCIDYSYIVGVYGELQNRKDIEEKIITMLKEQHPDEMAELEEARKDILELQKEIREWNP